MQTVNTAGNGGVTDGFAQVNINDDGTISGGVDYYNTAGPYDES